MKNINIKNVSSDIEAIIKKDKRFLDDKGEIIKSELIEKVISLDTDLIKLLTKNHSTLSLYFTKVDTTLVFDRQKFLDFISSSEFLPKSYTAFENQIGLINEGRKLLSNSREVVLNFPFKDCILEGGQDKGSEGRDEVFFNTILAPDEIDRLKEPKALVNFKKYTKDGPTTLDKIDRENDNLILRGNNLLALFSVLPKYAGKIKLIYIDPPYNTGSDDFKYNDKFNHSTWLVFMKNRLEIAKKLLSNNGTIFVQCDDGEQAYLKVLMDDVFGRENYLNTVTVKAKASSGASGGGEDKRIKKNTEYLLIYQASEEFAGFYDVYSDKPLRDYIDERKEASKNFAYKTVFVNEIKKKYVKTISSGRGDDIKIYKIEKPIFSSVSKISKEQKISEYEVYEKYFNKIFTLENAQTSIRGRVLDAVGADDEYYIAEYVPVSGKNKGVLTEVIFGGKTKRLLSWLRNVSYKNTNNELIKRDKVGTLWDDLSWSSITIEGGVTLENGKKPEALVERIISMATNKGRFSCPFFGHRIDSASVTPLKKFKGLYNPEKFPWNNEGEFLRHRLEEINLKS